MCDLLEGMAIVLKMKKIFFLHLVSVDYKFFFSILWRLCQNIMMQLEDLSCLGKKFESKKLKKLYFFQAEYRVFSMY